MKNFTSKLSDQRLVRYEENSLSPSFADLYFWEAQFDNLDLRHAKYLMTLYLIDKMYYHAGEDPSAENEYLGGFCLDRKIDLTSYIKWWGPNKSRQADPVVKSYEEAKHGYAEDISGELKKSEWAIQPTEPYEMPRLGMPIQGKKKGSAASALSILANSSAYKSFQEKALIKQEKNTDNDENENKNIVNKMDYGKAVEKSASLDGGNERLGAALGLSGGLSLQKNMFPLAPFLSAPLLTNYNAIDHLVDPILWTSLVPALPTGLARNPEVGILSITKMH